MAAETTDQNTETTDSSCSWRLVDEIKTNEKMRLEDVNALREFYLSLTKDQAASVSDNVIAAFLHSADYDLDEAKTAVKKNFDARSTTPEVFANREIDNKDVQTALDAGYMIKLPTVPNGYRIFLYTLRNTDPSLYDHAGQAKVQFLSMDASVHESPTCPGYIYVSDTSGFSMRHMFKMSWHLAKKLIKYQQEGVPIKIRHMFCVNASSFTHKIFNLAKPLISQELWDMLKFYTAEEMDKLLEDIPKECLPKEYGGTLSDLETLREDTIKWLRRMQPKIAVSGN